MIPWGNLPFAKRTLIGWMSGTQKGWDRIDWRPLRLGEVSFWLKASMIGGKQTMPHLNYTLALALKMRKSLENLSQGTKVLTWPGFHHVIPCVWVQYAITELTCLYTNYCRPIPSEEWQSVLQRKHHTSTLQRSIEKRCLEITAVYTENHMKPINAKFTNRL
jgi:hypothetical protein